MATIFPPPPDPNAELPDVGVWDYDLQRFINHFPCPGEKRVRVDVPAYRLRHLAVYPVKCLNQRRPEQGDRVLQITDTHPLKDWRIDLS